MFDSQVSGHCDVISRTYTERVRHRVNVWVSSFLSSFMGSLCLVRNKIMYMYVRGESNAFLDTKNQLDALTQLAYYLDRYIKYICSWSSSVHHLEIKPTIFMRQILELT